MPPCRSKEKGPRSYATLEWESHNAGSARISIPCFEHHPPLLHRFAAPVGSLGVVKSRIVAVGFLDHRTVEGGFVANIVDEGRAKAVHSVAGTAGHTPQRLAQRVGTELEKPAILASGDPFQHRQHLTGERDDVFGMRLGSFGRNCPARIVAGKPEFLPFGFGDFCGAGGGKDHQTQGKRGFHHWRPSLLSRFLCLALPQSRHEVWQLFVGQCRVVANSAAFAPAGGQPERIHRSWIDVAGPKQGAVVTKNRFQPVSKLASDGPMPETIHYRLDVGGGDRGERSSGKLLRVVEERTPPAVFRLGVPPAVLVAIDIG